MLPVAAGQGRQVRPHFAQNMDGENIDFKVSVVLSKD